MIRIVIADDHAIVREGVKRIVAGGEDMVVLAEAADGTEVMQRVRELEFDVLVLDLSMPGRSGMELIKLVKSEKPKLRILVLSMHGEQQYAARVLKAGAAGYLGKDSASELLLSTIRKIATGGMHIPEAAAAGLVASDKPAHESLSDREFEVLRLLVEGLGPTDIAERLHLSVKTVSTHKTRILEKLNLGSTAELVRYALEQKLV